MCTCSLAKDSNTSVTVTKGQAIAYRCQPIAYLKVNSLFVGGLSGL